MKLTTRIDSRAVFCAFALAGGALTSAAATAQQTLILPAAAAAGSPTGRTADQYPFNRTSSRPTGNDHRVQYVYDSGDFTGAAANAPLLIQGLRFRARRTASSWVGGTYARCDVRIGASQFNFDALAPDFAANYVAGQEPAPVYSGPVVVQPGTGNGAAASGPWIVQIQFPQPIVYDPRPGEDFILDIANSGDWTPNIGINLGSIDVEHYSGVSAGALIDLFEWNQSRQPPRNWIFAPVCELSFTPLVGPAARFTADPLTAGLGEPVTFTDRSITSDPGGVTGRDWDFDGDGITDATGAQVTWSFTSCGPQTVSLTATSASGSATRTRPQYVDIVPPIAQFTVTPPAGFAPVTVQFTDVSRFAPTLWSWDFNGDGVIDSTLQNPQHTFVSEGVFEVSLTAANACGSDTTSVTVDTRRGLSTAFSNSNGGVTGAGAYVDLNVLNPNGLTITELGLPLSDGGVPSFGGFPFSVEVFVKPGSYVGSDQSRSQWTPVSSGSGVAAARPQESLVDISDFSLPPGRWAMVVVYTMALNFQFTASPTPTNVSNADLALSGGSVVMPAFFPVFGVFARGWEGALYYRAGTDAGVLEVIGDGCLSPASGFIPAVGIRGGGVPTIGEMFTLETGLAPPNQPMSFVLLGFQPLVGGVDLGLIGMPGCRLFLTPSVSLPAPTGAFGTGATAPLSVGNDPALLGVQFLYQGVVADPGANALGVVVSSATLATIGN